MGLEGEFDPAAVGCHQLPSHNAVDGVIAPLGQDMRLQRCNQLQRRIHGRNGKLIQAVSGRKTGTASGTLAGAAAAKLGFIEVA